MTAPAIGTVIEWVDPPMVLDVRARVSDSGLYLPGGEEYERPAEVIGSREIVAAVDAGFVHTRPFSRGVISDVCDTHYPLGRWPPEGAEVVDDE